ncbi:MAG: hypothetical protein WCP52_06920 [Bacteroidota bacterium]
MRYLFYIKLACNFLPIVFGLWFKTYKEKTMNLVFYILVLMALLECIEFVCILLYHNNLFMMRYHATLQIIVYTYYFYHIIHSVYKKSIFFVGTLLFFLTLAFDLMNNNMNESANYVFAIMSLLFSVYSLMVFYQYFIKTETDNILQIPAFWINTGILVYFGGSFILYLFSTIFLTESHVNKLSAFLLTDFLQLVFYLFVILGFWKQKTHKK